MAVYDILPTTDLHYSDIRDTLNAGGGSVNNNVASAFKEAANINIWSKHKPVKHYYLFCQDFDTSKPNYVSDWWKGRWGDCGISFPIVNSYRQVKDVYDENLNGWNLNLPIGDESEPLRQGDFARYDTSATRPFGDMSSSPRESKSGVIKLYVTLNGLTLKDTDYNLGLNNFDEVAKRYFGVTLINTTNDSDTTYMVSDKKLSDIDVPAISHTFNMYVGNGEYIIVPVLFETSNAGSPGNVLVLPFKGTNLIVRDDLGTGISVQASLFEKSRQLYYSFNMTAGSDGAHLFQNNYLQIKVKDADVGIFFRSFEDKWVDAGEYNSFSAFVPANEIGGDFDVMLREAKNGNLIVEGVSGIEYVATNAVDLPPG